MPGVKGSCWRCEHWAGDCIEKGSHSTCLRKPDRILVTSMPMEGCAFWSLSPGLDGMTDQEADQIVKATRQDRSK